MSKLTDFLLGNGTNHSGKTFADIMGQGVSEFEMAHDQIQWLFPLPEVSRFQPDAPVLTREDYKTLRAYNYHLDRLVSAKIFFIEFLHEYPLWMVPRDHNHLRITRAIKCISLFRGPLSAQSFLQDGPWDALNKTAGARRPVPENERFWVEAVDYVESKEIKEWKS